VIPRNCLSTTLDLLHQQGGAGLARRSEHWELAHVMHLSELGILSSYGPPARLDKPAEALWGFDGVIRDYDASPLRPMTIRGIWASSLLLFLGATGWAISRAWRKWMAR